MIYEKSCRDACENQNPSNVFIEFMLNGLKDYPFKDIKHCVHFGLCIMKCSFTDPAIRSHTPRSLMSVPHWPSAPWFIWMSFHAIYRLCLDASASASPRDIRPPPPLAVAPAGVSLDDRNWTMLLQFPNPPLSMHHYIPATPPLPPSATLVLQCSSPPEVWACNGRMGGSICFLSLSSHHQAVPLN